MKKYLKILTLAVLFSVSTLSFAVPPARGTYTAHLYNDDATKNSPAQSWDICIENNGFWYMGNGNPILWYGKWFNRGNDTHFQSIAKPNSTMSFNVSRINNKLSTGYYTGLMNSFTQNMTMTLTYKNSTCFYDDPLYEWPVFEYTIN